jgi:acetyl-CoA C-acetyltransferase
MREVAIIGVGQTTVDEHWEKSLRILAGEAIISALIDARRENVDAIFVGNMLSCLLSKQDHIGTIIADWIGLKGIEAYKVEAACGSGAAALRLGMMAVSSGEIDSAVIVGVEKMTDGLPNETTEALVLRLMLTMKLPRIIVCSQMLLSCADICLSIIGNINTLLNFR